MANEQNLTQKGKRLSTEEAQRLAQKSAEARRRKKEVVKSARAFALATMNAVLTDEHGKEYVVKDAMIKKLIARAIQEVDLSAIKYILELIGESPQDANMADDNIPTDVEHGITIDAWIKNQLEVETV